MGDLPTARRAGLTCSGSLAGARSKREVAAPVGSAPIPRRRSEVQAIPLGSPAIRTILHG